MPKIDKQTEAKLLKAADAIAVSVAGGTAPNEAVVKTARDVGLSGGEIDAVVRAFNVGRTTRQRQDGSDWQEKSANFELADAEAVKAELYPETVKTAAQSQRETAVSTEYAASPVGVLERRESFVKAARKLDWVMVDKKPEAYPRDPAAVMAEAHSKAAECRRAIDTSRRGVAEAFDKIGAAFSGLSEYFRSPDSVSFRHAREVAVLQHGGVATRIYCQLKEYMPGIEKMASPKTRNDAMLRADAEPCLAVLEVIDCLEFYKKSSAEHKQLAAEKTAEAEQVLAPFSEAANAISPIVLDDVEASSTTKAALLGLGALTQASYLGNQIKNIGSNVQQNFRPQTLSYNNNELDRVLNDPIHENELRNIEVEANLHDLIMNDEAISGYDPDQVIDAFNEVMELTPNAANNKAALRALLAKRLEQGQFADFDISQSLDINKQLQPATTRPPKPAQATQTEQAQP